MQTLKNEERENTKWNTTCIDINSRMDHVRRDYVHVCVRVWVWIREKSNWIQILLVRQKDDQCIAWNSCVFVYLWISWVNASHWFTFKHRASCCFFLHFIFGMWNGSITHLFATLPHKIKMIVFASMITTLD